MFSECHRGEDVQQGGDIQRGSALDGFEIPLYRVCVVDGEDVSLEMADVVERLQKSSCAHLGLGVKDEMSCVVVPQHVKLREELDVKRVSDPRWDEVSRDVVRYVVNCERFVKWRRSRASMKARSDSSVRL